MEKKIVDQILVSSGLVFMVAYYMCLFYRIVRHPNKTVIGINAINRRLWVRALMEDVNHSILNLFFWGDVPAYSVKKLNSIP